MPNLEYVIRPYQSPTPFGTIIIPSTTSQGRERATITWGATAQGTMPEPEPVPTTSPTDQTYQFECCNEQLQEQSRDNERKRIIGNDGISYVDVDRPKIVRLKKSQHQHCDSPLEQDSFVAQGINSVLDAWDDEFAGRTVKPGDDCNTQWNLKNGP
jgi:hypothetical protein